MKRRVLPLVTGVGALAAFVAMVGFVVANSEDATVGPAALPGLRAEALTLALHDDQLTAVAEDQIPSRLERIAQSGASLARVDVSWVDIAPTKPADGRDPDDPAYRWATLDAVIDGLVSRDVAVLATIARTPSWANGGQGPEFAPNPDDYAAFIRAFATRYRGNAHGVVSLVEPWNEPNNPTFLQPQWTGTGPTASIASADTYATLVARADAELSSVSKDIAVIGVTAGDIPTSEPPTGGVGVTDFLQALAQRRLPLDAVSQHLRPLAAPNAPADAVPSFSTLPRLVSEVDKIAPGVPILITEVGYSTAPGVLSEDDQALYLGQAVERLAGSSRVRLAVWSTVQDTVERPSGLIRVDGSEKPAWAAFQSRPKVLPSATGP